MLPVHVHIPCFADDPRCDKTSLDDLDDLLADGAASHLPDELSIDKSDLTFDSSIKELDEFLVSNVSPMSPAPLMTSPTMSLAQPMPLMAPRIQPMLAMPSSPPSMSRPLTPSNLPSSLPSILVGRPITQTTLLLTPTFLPMPLQPPTPLWAEPPSSSLDGSGSERQSDSNAGDQTPSRRRRRSRRHRNAARAAAQPINPKDEGRVIVQGRRASLRTCSAYIMVKRNGKFYRIFGAHRAAPEADQGASHRATASGSASDPGTWQRREPRPEPVLKAVEPSPDNHQPSLSQPSLEPPVEQEEPLIPITPPSSNSSSDLLTSPPHLHDLLSCVFSNSQVEEGEEPNDLSSDRVPKQNIEEALKVDAVVQVNLNEGVESFQNILLQQQSVWEHYHRSYESHLMQSEEQLTRMKTNLLISQVSGEQDNMEKLMLKNLNGFHKSTILKLERKFEAQKDSFDFSAEQRSMQLEDSSSRIAELSVKLDAQFDIYLLNLTRRDEKMNDLLKVSRKQDEAFLVCRRQLKEYKEDNGKLLRQVEDHEDEWKNLAKSWEDWKVYIHKLESRITGSCSWCSRIGLPQRPQPPP
jgi:hypothetical protein